MTNRILTAITLRIAGIFLFIKIFDHFGSYFLSIYSTAILAQFEEQLGEPIDKLYFTGTFLIVADIALSLFLFLKAEWISKKLIKTDKELAINLNPKSLSKVILMTVGIIWLANSIYLIPDFIEYCIQLTSKLNGNTNADVPNISAPKYIIKTIIAMIFIFRIEKISSWIVKKM